MKLLTILFTLLICLSPALCAADQNPFAIPRYSTEYNPNRDPFIDGKNALEYARVTNRKVLIEVGGNWCQWCHILDEFIHNHPLVKKALHDHFVLLKVNVSDKNKNEKFMRDMPAVDGYPHVFITDRNGSIKFSGDLSPLLVRGKFSEKRFLKFLNRWK